MALINQILNRINCGAGNTGGLTNPCPIDIKQIVAGIRIPDTFKVGAEVDFNLEYVIEQFQMGVFDIVPNIINMANNTPENSFSTQDSTGVQALTLKSPYLWNFMFNKGLYNFKSLTTRESNSGYAWMWVDVAGNIFGASDKQGNFRGLKTHLFSVGAYVPGNDNTHMATVQTDRYDFDQNVAWITAENIDFDGNDLQSWADATITLVNPTDGATSIIFDIVTRSNSKSLVPIGGLQLTDLLFTKDGATLTPSAIAPVAGIPGRYNATVTALETGEEITLRLFAPAVNGFIANLGDAGFYQSNVASAVVV